MCEFFLRYLIELTIISTITYNLDIGVKVMNMIIRCRNKSKKKNHEPLLKLKKVE